MKMLSFTFVCVCVLGWKGEFWWHFFESSHRVYLVELLLYDNFCATRIKDIVYKVQDYSFFVLFCDIAALPVYVRVGILLTS